MGDRTRAFEAEHTGADTANGKGDPLKVFAGVNAIEGMGGCCLTKGGGSPE